MAVARSLFEYDKHQIVDFEGANNLRFCKQCEKEYEFGMF